jgi:hypothetical protein
VEIDSSRWSGEGEFTHVVLDHLSRVDGIEAIRVEDAPSSRSDADYNFISNEIFLVFRTLVGNEPIRRFRFIPGVRRTEAKALTVGELETLLTAIPGVGGPDYSDQGMLQYLRTERIIPPYQTRGYKLVELVRIYEAGARRD